MIAVAEALELIKKHVSLLDPVTINLRDARGFVLAHDIHSPLSSPPFCQSSKDGYAFCFADLMQTKMFTITGERAAGDAYPIRVQPFEAVRIFTGAALPEGCDTVVMQEKTDRQNTKLIIRDDVLIAGSNVRPMGADIQQGDIAMWAHTVITPAAMGFLAGLGIYTVSVFPQPVVHIIVTGKELVAPGQVLQHGQVYETNSIMLTSGLAQLGLHQVSTSFTGDDPGKLVALLQEALQRADLIILTGGVSVGDYDFVVQATQDCGVQQLFHTVAQRPGKPLYAGIKDHTLIFGLPGNPAAVLTCLYMYVVPAIEIFTGRKNLVQQKRLPLTKGFNKMISLRQFLKGRCTTDGVLPLPAQESFQLSSFAVANCLINLSEEKKEYAAGDIVEVMLLPYL